MRDHPDWKILKQMEQLPPKPAAVVLFELYAEVQMPKTKDAAKRQLNRWILKGTLQPVLFEFAPLRSSWTFSSRAAEQMPHETEPHRSGSAHTGVGQLHLQHQVRGRPAWLALPGLHFPVGYY